MKNIHRILSFLLMISISVLLISCSDNKAQSTDELSMSEAGLDDHEGEENGHGEEGEEEGIHLSHEQIQTVGVRFGQVSQSKVNDFVTATGVLGLPPDTYSSVSAPASGFIKSTKQYVNGSYIEKGAFLAYLENPDFAALQQEYLEAKAALIYLEQSLSRQKELVSADAGVEKNLQRLQSEVDIKMATVSGLAKRLDYYGLDIHALSPQTITDRIEIRAPIAGYITDVNFHNGIYVSPEIELMEIVSTDHLHLELDVFENDLAKIEVDQLISYTVPSFGESVYQAEVHVIGVEFNQENKTVRVHGHLDEENQPRFMVEAFVNAKIWLNDETVDTLPEDAIIKDGDPYYVYLVKGDDGDEVEFEPVMVVPGATNDGFTAITFMNPLPADVQFVTEGAYFVYAKSKAGSLEHDD